MQATQCHHFSSVSHVTFLSMEGTFRATPLSPGIPPLASYPSGVAPCPYCFVFRHTRPGDQLHRALTVHPQKGPRGEKPGNNVRQKCSVRPENLGLRSLHTYCNTLLFLFANSTSWPRYRRVLDGKSRHSNFPSEDRANLQGGRM